MTCTLRMHAIFTISFLTLTLLLLLVLLLEYLLTKRLLDLLSCNSLSIIRSLCTVYSFCTITHIGYQRGGRDWLIGNLSLLNGSFQLLWCILHHPFSSLSNLILRLCCDSSRCSYRNLRSMVPISRSSSSSSSSCRSSYRRGLIVTLHIALINRSEL